MTETRAREPSSDATAVAEERAGPKSTGGTFRSLKYRDFRLLWMSTLFISAGQWFQQITVGWLVWDMTGSEFLLGSVNGVRALPMLIAPFGGVAADRLDRKWLLQGTAVGLFFFSAAMVAILLADVLEVWHLFAFMFITGVIWSFNNPVRQSIVPNLVPKNELMNALALQSAGFNFSRIVGPALAGIVLVHLGAAENFGLQTLTYVGVFLMVLPMVVPAVARANPGSVRESLSEGLHYVLSHRTLRTQFTLAFIPPLLAFPYMALMPVFATEVYGREAGAFGLMGSAVGVGAVIGTLAIATLTNVERRGLVLLSAILALGIALVAFSQMKSFELGLVFLAVIGAAQMVYLTTNQTLLQLTVPDEMRGRAMGIYMLSFGMQPLGGLVGGGLAAVIGAPSTILLLGSLVCVLAVGYLTFARELRAA